MTAHGTFKHRIPVSFGDVDYARILYYPRLFHFCHAVMEAFFDGVGFNYAKLLVERKIGFPTVHTEADYRIPMPYGIVLEFDLTVRSLGTTQRRVPLRGPRRRARRTSAPRLGRPSSASTWTDSRRSRFPRTSARSSPEYLEV